MRLTVLSVSYPLAKVSPATAGGAEQVLATIDSGLVSAGHRSLVLAPEGSRCSGLLIAAQVPSGVLDESAKREARRIFKELLERTLTRYSVDVVHMHGVDFYEYLPESDVPIVVTTHLPLQWYPRRRLLHKPVNVLLVGVSDFQARTAPPEVEIDCVIPNGVDVEEIGPRRQSGDYVLAMGRICPEKGFHLALEAAEIARGKLILAGMVFDYPEHRSYFDSMIAPRLGRSARFIGPVGGIRKRQLLSGAKCLLIPSQVSETSSLLAMEAMAAGTPVIAWRSGALPEIVSDGKTGFVVASIEDMASAISRINHIDRRACRREAIRRFDGGKMLSSYLCLYQAVARRSFTPELQAA
jgi:glycosyltransferase involved in cell wall biosynthesis